MPKFFHTEESEPFQAGGQTVTLVSQALRLTPSLGMGGLIWNRPVAVKVQTSAGVEHILPITDETRQGQIAVLLLGGLTIFLILLFWRTKK